MQKEISKERMKAMRIELAKQLLSYLEDTDDTQLVWKDTKMHLIELVRYLYESEMMRNEVGIPISLNELVRRTCCKFNVTVPKRLSTYTTRINNIKGVRMQTLLDMSIYMEENKGEKLVIRRFIQAAHISTHTTAYM